MLASQVSLWLVYGTHFVSVAPKVVLGTQVLVWVLRPLLQRLHVVPMSPMRSPEVVSVDTGNDKARDGRAVSVSPGSLVCELRSTFAGSQVPY